METSQGESGMGDMLEIMKMDMMSQMQQRHDQQESEREQREDERICWEEERSRREEERSRCDEDSQFMRMMMNTMIGNMRQLRQTLTPTPTIVMIRNERQKTKNRND